MVKGAVKGYLEEEKTKVILPPGNDAIMTQARPGVKAGNPVIDHDLGTYRRTMKDISRIINMLHAIVDKQIGTLSNDIENIIANESLSRPEIEVILDSLLDYAIYGKGEEEFKRLNGYYSKIDPKAAKEYTKLYRETLTNNN